MSKTSYLSEETSAIDLLDHEWLKPREVARIFRVNRKTIYSMIETGDLPFRRLGRTIRIPRVEVIRISSEST